MAFQADLGSVKGLEPRERTRFASYAEYLAAEEPTLALQFDPASRRGRIVGRIRTNIGAGISRYYHVEFRFNDLDPFSAPEAWDRGRHFRPDGERHVEDHGNDGWRWCLWLPTVPEVDFQLVGALAQYLEKVRGFIRKQLIYDDRRRRYHPKPWPGEEWSHGDVGYVEWLEETLGEIDVAGLMRLLPYLKVARLSYNKTCPCGSGMKAGICHREAAERIRSARGAFDLDKIVAKLVERKGTAHARSSP